MDKYMLPALAQAAARFQAQQPVTIEPRETGRGMRVGWLCTTSWLHRRR
jgi:hypothetical protein